MALLGPSFQIGRSALAAYQSAIAIVGQNIANVGNADYTRQTGRLSAIPGGPTLGGVSPGAGVRMSELQRHVDQAVETRLRMSIGTKSNAAASYRALSQIETLYNELTDQDLSSQLDEFFAAFAALQTNPTDMTSRNLLVSAAETTARTIQRQRAGLLGLAEDMNRSVEQATQRASAIAAEIADLNGRIAQEEASSQGTAGPLRDRRDALLRELSGLIEVQTREQANGAVNVYVGSEPLVDFSRSRGLTTVLTLDEGIERATVRFADNNGPVALRDGELAGLVATRDEKLAGQVERLDRLASGIIYEVNRIQSTGRGIADYATVQGTYGVLDPTAALSSAAAGLNFPVSNGTFIVHVRDAASGREITRQIKVDLDGIGTDTSLARLAAALDAVPGLNASVTTDNRLRIDGVGGNEFWFSDDRSGALAALGVATFFEGNNASDIAVRSEIKQRPHLIAASLSGAPGDGGNASRFALIADATSVLLDGQSVLDFHAQTVGLLAVETAAARTAEEATDAVYAGLVAQREAVSGVSLDEEALNLTKFEKSYQGAARFLTVLDQLADEMLALVR